MKRRLSMLALPALAAPLIWSGVAAPGAPLPHILTLVVPLPAPGHVSLETLDLTVTSNAPLPGLLRLTATGRNLPSSTRVLWAARRLSVGRSTRYALAVLSFNIAPRRSKSAVDETPRSSDLIREESDDAHAMAALALFFGSPAAAEYLEEEADKLGTEWFYAKATEENARARSFQNLDKASPAQARKPATTLEELFGANGGNGLVFDQPANADPTLDTGHYDDGHAFGWKVNTPAAEDKVFGDLRDLTNGRLDELVADLERDLGADINGDGKIGAPAKTATAVGAMGSSSGASINTQVGAVTVSGGT